MISLEPGETKKVSFTINIELLKFYTANKRWEAEPGDFNVFIGGNSRTLLQNTFQLQHNH